MGVKTELNIFVTDLSYRVARERAVFINGTINCHQEDAQLKGTHSRSFRVLGTNG